MFGLAFLSENSRLTKPAIDLELAAPCGFTRYPTKSVGNIFGLKKYVSLNPALSRVKAASIQNPKPSKSVKPFQRKQIIILTHSQTYAIYHTNNIV